MLAFLLVAALGAATAQSSGAEHRSSDVEKAADSRDKVICKRFTETGSLVKGYRICKKKWEWEAARDQTRASMAGGSTACSDPSRCGS